MVIAFLDRLIAMEKSIVATSPMNSTVVETCNVCPTNSAARVANVLAPQPAATDVPIATIVPMRRIAVSKGH